jgi:hypothetical protein
MAQSARLLVQDTIERRVSDRRVVSGESTVRAADARPVSSIVHDLSTGGATIETEADLPLGETVTIGLPMVGRHAATVVRRTGNRYACHFKHPLDATYVKLAFTGDNVIRGAFVVAAPPSEAEPQPEPYVEKWHPALRVTLIIGLSSALWSAILHIF